MSIFATYFILIYFCISPSLAQAASDEEIINGFNLTVFGAEFSNLLGKPKYIRKYSKPVRFMVHNFASKNRKPTVERFIKTLSTNIHGLHVSITNNARKAQFNVYIVDKKNYLKTARENIKGKARSNISGSCFVNVLHWRGGISRSDVIIVSDKGDALFKHCMIEEILQGLGALNDNQTSRESIFNDYSHHTNFTKFDKLIMNMLYDKRIKNGANIKSVQKHLPAILKDAKRKVR